MAKAEEAPEQKGLLDKMIDGLKQKWDGLYIGEGHAAAMGRLGLAELRNAFDPTKETVSDRDFGLYGSATQGEIADAREAKPLTLDGMRAAAEKAREDGKGLDGPERGREGPER